MAEAFGVAASALAVTELSAKVVKLCLRYAKDVAASRDDIERLRKEVIGLSDVAKSVKDLSDNSPQSKVTTMKNLQPILEESRTRLQELQSKLDPGSKGTVMRKFGIRAFTWPFKRKDIEKVFTELGRLTQAISLAMQVGQTATLLGIDQRMVLEKLPVAEGATYDSYADEHSPQCLPGTRTDILQEISGWAAGLHTKPVYWLNGMAGTGKSTISRTLACTFSENGALGATFFFKRGEGDRGGMRKFFTTITSQLIQQVPEMATHVRDAIAADPLIVSKAMREQLEKLIMHPISNTVHVSSSSCTRIIIIDALDECEREEDVGVLIKLLPATSTTPNPPLKFFLTSRPELPIRLGFRAVNGTYQDFILHEVAEPVIEHDIAIYLKYQLRQIREDHNQSASDNMMLGVDWPSDANLQTLIKMASPLFIFAATVCRFISDGRVGSPDEQLTEVLRYQSKSQISQFDATYLPILHHMIAGLNHQTRNRVLERFHTVVGTIVTLANPLSIPAIARLLGLPIGSVLSALNTMHSVLNIPESDDQPVRLLHLSFRDFLVDEERHDDPFWIDEKQTHHQLARQCLRVLHTSLKEDICDVRTPGKLASSIRSTELDAKLGPEVQYACRFWTHHSQEGTMDGSDTESIWDFLSVHFLHWLETLSWMNRFDESIPMIQILQSLFRETDHRNISEFLDDSLRFIQTMASSVQMAPLQIYSSALIFSPTSTKVREMYERSIPSWIFLQPTVPSNWNRRVRTLEGHTSVVSSVMFSSDGQQLVSASSDCTVRMWAVDTGRIKQTLRGHTGKVASVAFSPDDKWVASASWDKTVRIWDVSTGEVMQISNGHKYSVESVTFSPDLRYVASASGDGTVKVWAVDTGELEKTLVGHEARVTSVAFSPNSERIASASYDRTVIIWSITTATPEKILTDHGNNVLTVSFSSDGRRVVSGSYDNTVKIWATDTGKLEQTISGQWGGISCVALSPDGKRVAFGAGDGIVRIWTVGMDEPMQILKGHTRQINSIAFSSDGKRLASGAHDRTMIIWDVDMGDPNQTISGHKKYVSSVALSSDGKRVASASTDRTILWKTDTGKIERTSEGLEHHVDLVALSPNSELIASVRDWTSIMIWDAGTGKVIQELEGHAEAVTSAAFSSCGKLLCSGSYDQTVRIWDVETGRLERTLDHVETVKSVVFSPDNRLVGSVAGHMTLRIWAADTGKFKNQFKNSSSLISKVAFSYDGTLVMSASEEGKVLIWSITGILTHTIDIGVCPFNIGFYFDDMHVLTDVGMLAIQRSRDTTRPPEDLVRTNSDNDIGYGISRDRSWITRNGKGILWLPVEYRPSHLAISESTVVIGCASGHVLIMRFE